MKKKDNKTWPYSVAASIIVVAIACVVTVMIALSDPVQTDETLMMPYHEVEANINKVINAEIAFNKKYHVHHYMDSFKIKGSVIKYEITDDSGVAIKNATIELILTRPIHEAHNKFYTMPSFIDGQYVFELGDLELKGAWNILAKVTIGKDYRHYNLKVHSQYPSQIKYFDESTQVGRFYN